MLTERDLVPAFSIYLCCKSLPHTAPAQLPESSLLHSGAERVGCTHQIIQKKDYVKDVCTARLFKNNILYQRSNWKLSLNQTSTFKNATFSLVVCNPPLC